MRKQPKKNHAPPATKLTWKDRADYDRVVKAAGSIPIATYVMDVFLRAFEKRNAA